MFNSTKTKSLLDSHSPAIILNNLSEVKVQSSNIEFERFKPADEDDVKGDITERTSITNNLGESLKNLNSSLSLLAFLKMFLDSKPFVESTQVEITNAIFRKKSLDVFVTAIIHRKQQAAIIVMVDSTNKSKRVFVEESDKYKARVLGYISHTLKNPIHSIQNAISTLMNNTVV